MSTVVTRFAPSPTGSLHIGGIRSALYPYALARKSGGKFILRIEDTDQKRKVEGGEKYIMDALKAYGLEWDELYRQSERLHIYQEHAEKLVELGHAYYSFETKEELTRARELAQANKQVFRYRSPDRDLSAKEARSKKQKGKSYVIRLKSPENEELTFEDAVQGKMKFNTADIDDTVLLKSDGYPTYHLAVVVDDKLMGVTHVLRGFGWIPSIPKHILIHRAFGWEMPVYAHLTDILNPDGHGKLSKRHGSVSALSFLEQGYLPEAVLNFLMLLGWSSPEQRVHGEKEREIFSLEEFVRLFDLKDLNKSNQRFNPQKLNWFNQQYILNTDSKVLLNKFLDWLQTYTENKELLKLIEAKGTEMLSQIIELIKPRIKLLSEVPEQLKQFYYFPEKVQFNSLKKLDKITEEQFKKVIVGFSSFWDKLKDDLSDLSQENWESQVRGLAEELGIKAGDAFMCIRVASMGSEVSPPLLESLRLLGKAEINKRLKIYS